MLEKYRILFFCENLMDLIEARLNEATLSMREFFPSVNSVS